MWTVKYITAQESKAYELSDLNHTCMASSKEFLEIYDHKSIELEHPEIQNVGYSFLITDYHTNILNYKGEELTIAIYDTNGKFYWESMIDRLKIQKIPFINVKSFSRGYEIGTVSPTREFSQGGVMSSSMIAGYRIWFKIEKETGTVCI